MAQSGAPVVFSPGSSSLYSATVRGNFFVTAGILDGCSPRCDPPCGQRVGANFFLTELKGAKIDGVAVTAGMQAGCSLPAVTPYAVSG